MIINISIKSFHVNRILFYRQNAFKTIKQFYVFKDIDFYMRLILLRVQTSSRSMTSNHRLPKDLHRRVRMLSMYISCYRPHGIIVIVANAVEYLAASQPGLRLCLRFPCCLCGQERQYSSKWQLLSCIVMKNRIDTKKWY